MSWNAMLIDGPLEGRRMDVDEDDCDEAPPSIVVEGERYVYCGFSDNTPRYRHTGAVEAA
jgi:hypothetical protein